MLFLSGCKLIFQIPTDKIKKNLLWNHLRSLWMWSVLFLWLPLMPNLEWAEDYQNDRTARVFDHYSLWANSLDHAFSMLALILCKPSTALPGVEVPSKGHLKWSLIVVKMSRAFHSQSATPQKARLSPPQKLPSNLITYIYCLMVHFSYYNMKGNIG